MPSDKPLSAASRPHPALGDMPLRSDNKPFALSRAFLLSCGGKKRLPVVVFLCLRT